MLFFFHFYFSFSFCCICYKSLCACRKWSELKHPIGRKDQMISIFFRKKNQVKVTPCIIIDDSRDNGSPRNDKCAMTTFSCSNFSFLSFSSLHHHRLSHHHFYFQFFFVYFSPMSAGVRLSVSCFGDTFSAVVCYCCYF